MATNTQFGQSPLPQLRTVPFTPRNIDSPFTPTLFVRLLLTGAFFLTLMQYWIVTFNAGLIPLAMLYVAGLVVLLSRDRVNKLARILSGGSLLILFSLLSEVISYFTNSTYSIQYGLILIGLFLVARLIILQIGFLQVVRCYTYSAAACSLIILVAGRKQLSAYAVVGGRFTGGASAHPNLLGFTLASYVPLFVGMALDLPPGKKRLFYGVLAAVTVGLLFTTGSRGSLGAIIFAAAVTVLRFTVFNPLVGKLRFRLTTVVFMLLGVAGIIFVLFHGSTLAHTIKFVVEALQLNNSQRGIHSGFSGRTVLWVAAFRRLRGLGWLFGMGYRQSYTIDNGYITILFENGIVGGSVILGVMLRAFYWLWRSTSRMDSAGWWRYHIVIWNMLIIYFINNFVARYLFSYGNQYSLLVIFVMVCQRNELLGRVPPVTTSARRVLPTRLAPALQTR